MRVTPFAKWREEACTLTQVREQPTKKELVWSLLKQAEGRPVERRKGRGEDGGIHEAEETADDGLDGRQETGRMK